MNRKDALFVVVGLAIGAVLGFAWSPDASGVTGTWTGALTGGAAGWFYAAFRALMNRRQAHAA